MSVKRILMDWLKKCNTYGTQWLHEFLRDAGQIPAFSNTSGRLKSSWPRPITSLGQKIAGLKEGVNSEDGVPSDTY